MATEALTPMERTNRGWFIPEDMPFEGVSLFPSPVVAKEMHEAEAVTRAAPLEMDQADEQEQASQATTPLMVVQVGEGNELGGHDSSLPEAMLVISRSAVCGFWQKTFEPVGSSHRLSPVRLLGNQKYVRRCFAVNFEYGERGVSADVMREMGGGGAPTFAVEA